MDDIDGMTEEQIESLFDVFIAETGDAAWDKSSNLRSLTSANKKLMLQAHYQRLQSITSKTKCSIDNFTKAIASGNLDLRLLTSLKVLLTSSPIG